MTIAFSDGMTTCHIGDVRTVLGLLDPESVDCVVTSPPYWGLRDYGHCGQLGLEATPAEYVENLIGVFRQIRRVLKPTGTAWLNLGDSFNNRTKVRSSSHQPALNDFADESWADSAANGGTRTSVADSGLKEKDLIGIPWRVALALQADGWWLRSDIIWNKPNPMPESVTDRPTRSHEYLFLLSKSATYHYDAAAVAEPTVGSTWHDVMGPPRLDVPGQSKQDGPGRRHAGFNERYFGAAPPQTRNKRDVWTIATQPYAGAHFATFPEALVEPCILAGCPIQGTVLDPFAGSGTTLAVAKRLDRRSVGIELNPQYIDLIAKRCAAEWAQMRIAI